MARVARGQPWGRPGGDGKLAFGGPEKAWQKV